MTTDDPWAEKLRDQPQQQFTVVDEADLVGTPTGSHDRWTVVVAPRAGPVALLPPGPARYRPDDLAASPAFVVADAGLDVDVALKSESFREIESTTGVVLVDNGQVVGLWGGPSLSRALLNGPTRMGGSVLPGDDDIPFIVRRCKYLEGSVVCGSQVNFPARPSTLPACVNPRSLGAHVFHW